ncbi:asparagine synthase-related protein [Thiohalocapsa sp. ML1]|uniref:asparagine synthase-related protein n=1 Tax=Thiohalocapsa sp. ML1 TaxID=1431688 RepID=UPI00138EF744|nr:asparagine synthase-related protein [Thiohalocapsa sp. ML1]
MADWSFGIQCRSHESELYESADLVVACHGSVYDASLSTPTGSQQSCAALLARSWRAGGAGCLENIDGDFSALVHHRGSGITYVFVSVSMARPLFVARADERLVLASEVRQVAAGGGFSQTLDLEQVVQSLLVGMPVMDTHRTEYLGIDRLESPRIYACAPHKFDVSTVGQYWTPPELQAYSMRDQTDLAAQVVELIVKEVDSLPAATGFALSGGYDSGLLWAVANRFQDSRQRFSAYSFYGSSADIAQGSPLMALLFRTRTNAAFVELAGLDPAPYDEANLCDVDRMPFAPTLYTFNVVAERMRADRQTGIVIGFGAEGWLSAPSCYAADELRSGRLLNLVVDALRFRPYSAHESGRAARMAAFLRAAVAPPGSTLYRLKRLRSAPDWLCPEWHNLASAIWESIDRTRAKEGYGRGHKWLALKHHAVGIGVERIEQLAERFGLDLFAPYMRRGFMEFGFSVPARVLNGGRHPKDLLRRCAAKALGADPPWSDLKLEDVPSGRSVGFLVDLGPPVDWKLVEVGIVAKDALADLLAQARRMGRVDDPLVNLVYKERYLRRYGVAASG